VSTHSVSQVSAPHAKATPPLLQQKVKINERKVALQYIQSYQYKAVNDKELGCTLGKVTA